MNESLQKCDTEKMYLWLASVGLISKIAMWLCLDLTSDQIKPRKKFVFGFLLDNFKVLISALVVICFLFILFSSYYFWDFTLMAKVENT